MKLLNHWIAVKADFPLTEPLSELPLTGTWRPWTGTVKVESYPLT
jgi:hypothetical protein